MIQGDTINFVVDICEKIHQHVDGAVAFVRGDVTASNQFHEAVERGAEFFVEEICKDANMRLSMVDGSGFGNDTLPRMRKVVEMAVSSGFADGVSKMTIRVLYYVGKEINIETI